MHGSQNTFILKLVQRNLFGGFVLRYLSHYNSELSNVMSVWQIDKFSTKKPQVWQFYKFFLIIWDVLCDNLANVQ